MRFIGECWQNHPLWANGKSKIQEQCILQWSPQLIPGGFWSWCGLQRCPKLRQEVRPLFSTLSSSWIGAAARDSVWPWWSSFLRPKMFLGGQPGWAGSATNALSSRDNENLILKGFWKGIRAVPPTRYHRSWFFQDPGLISSVLPSDTFPLPYSQPV